MPFLTPKKSGIHRVACFALYRALLREASRAAGVPLPTSRRLVRGKNTGTPIVDAKPGHTPRSSEASIVWHAVQQQFRNSAGLRGHRNVVKALEIGYEALDLLKSRDRSLDDHTLSKLATSLRSIYSWQVLQKGTLSQVKKANLSHTSSDSNVTPSGKPSNGPRVWRHPSTSTTQAHILSRPLPRSALTGKRHVPRLAVAQGMAFLRIKKPQPAYLSRIIRNRKTQNQKRVNLANQLKLWTGPLAEAEDTWDQRMGEVMRRVRIASSRQALAQLGIDDGATFKHSVKLADAELYQLRGRTKSKDNAWGEKLWQIYCKERQLKLEEEGVLVPVLGRSKERQQIVVQQRRERKLRNAERLARERAEQLERQAEKARRRAAARLRPAERVGLSSGDFVVRMEP